MKPKQTKTVKKQMEHYLSEIEDLIHGSDDNTASTASLTVNEERMTLMITAMKKSGNSMRCSYQCPK